MTYSGREPCRNGKGQGFSLSVRRAGEGGGQRSVMGGMPHHPLPRLPTPGCRCRKISSARAAHIYIQTRTRGRWSRLLGLECVCGTIFLKYGRNSCSPRQEGRSRAETRRRPSYFGHHSFPRGEKG